jgi:histidinol-phosphate/aromatic aminotransferase/cobyric acid decarboxylase-like protein
VLWINNPHNPTGQLWSREALSGLLAGHRLVICDEAFLPLVAGGEAQSLIPLLREHSNLVVIRSLTKLYGLAGVRLGYALGAPERLLRWASWRDPWPINGLALALGLQWLGTPGRYRRHCAWVQRWSRREGAWLRQQLEGLRGPAGVLQPQASAANFFLLRGSASLLPLRDALLQRQAIVLRDCRSFAGLDERWLRIGVQSHRQNRRLVRAMAHEWCFRPW